MHETLNGSLFLLYIVVFGVFRQGGLFPKFPRIESELEVGLFGNAGFLSLAYQDAPREVSVDLLEL